MKKKIALVLAALLLLGALSGCSDGTVRLDWLTGNDPDAAQGEQSQDAAQNEAEQAPVAPVTETSNELTGYGLAYQKEYGLDPFDCMSLNNRVILSFVYEPLFAVSSTYEAVPVLAEGYDVSGDGMTTTVYLRQGVTFHDGNPLTAQDVIYSIAQARGSDYYGSRFYALTGVTATGEHTLELTTSVAYECLPLLLDIPIIRDTSVDIAEAPEEPAPETDTEGETESEDTQTGTEEETLQTEPETVEAALPTGTGPYQYVSDTRLERFAAWWQGTDALLADFPYITLCVADTAADIRDHFEYEDVNLVRTDPNSSAYVSFHNDYELWSGATTVMQYIGYNLTGNVFSNYGLRSSITYAIDRDTIVSGMSGGFAQAASLPCPQEAPFYDARQANSYSYSLTRFHEQLESASVEDMDGDGILDLYVTSLGYAVPVKGTMIVCSSSYQRVQAATAVVDALNALGFDLTLKSMDYDDFSQALALGSFDLYYGEVRLSANFDLSQFFRVGGSLAYGALSDSYMANLCNLALANNGNNYNLYERLCGRGYITPVLFKNYAVYTTRGSVEDPSGYIDWFLPTRADGE